MGYARPAPEADDDDADAEEHAAIQEFDGEGAAKPAIEVFEI